MTRARSEEEPARALATPTGAETLLRLQSNGGNQMVGRLLASQQVVEEVRDALDGWNDEDAAIEALAGYTGDRALIRPELADYVKDQLDGQDLVRATALLYSNSLNDPHTRMALTMYGAGTRDAELFRILEESTLDGRRLMQRRYDEVFGPIGSGSLLADLADDLSDKDFAKASALLHRDLTAADQLYFDSVGRSGTDFDRVLGHIQTAWTSGVSMMAKLESDWKRFVNNGDRWTTSTWTTMSLREAVADELSGEEKELVFAVLDQYQRLGGAQAVAAAPQAIEDARMAAAQATLTAATTGGFIAAGTNEDQVFHAVTEIRAIWQGRIRASAGTPGEAGPRAGWEAERARLVAFIPSEMHEESADYKRVRLLLAGSLTPADELYMAWDSNDNDRVVDIITRTWAAGGMNDLLAAADTERCDGNQVIRPRFDPQWTVPVTSGMAHRRVYAHTCGLDDASRGAMRLKLELDDDDSDGALRLAYNVIKAAAPALRDATIAAFADRHLGEIAGDTPVRKFITYIQRRFQMSYSCYLFQDLIDPANTTEEQIARAQGKLDASHTGLLDGVLTLLTGAYGAMTGEQSAQVTQESLDRLRFIAAHENAGDGQLDTMAAMLGKRTDELAAFEYGAFGVRLEELRDVRSSIVDVIATVVEAIVQAAAAIATGGTSLLASLGAALAGMLTRELLQGKDYEFTSAENTKRMVVELAAAGMGSFGGTLTEGMQDVGSRAKFMREATNDVFAAIGRASAENAFSDSMPTAEDIATKALSIAGSAAGSGTAAIVGAGAKNLRANVSSAMANQLISGMSDEAATVLKTGIEHVTGPELVTRFARRAASSVISGMYSGATTTAVRHRSWREVERVAIAESKESWEGKQTEAQFVRHGQNFRSLAATLRKAKENGLLSTVDEQVLRTPIDEFIRTRPELAAELAELRRRAEDNRELGRDIDKFIGDGGDVSRRVPDIVEFYLDRGEIVITDITQDPLGPVHQLKTKVYVEVLRAIVGPGGPRVYALDINPEPSGGGLPVSIEYPPGR